MRSVVASGLKNGSWAGFEYRYMIWNNLDGNFLQYLIVCHLIQLMKQATF
jgi:hypothetical protein